jgi:hypothetical protein
MRNVITIKLSEIATIPLFFIVIQVTKTLKVTMKKHVKVYLKKEFPSVPSVTQEEVRIALLDIKNKLQGKINEQ